MVEYSQLKQRTKVVLTIEGPAHKMNSREHNQKHHELRFFSFALSGTKSELCRLKFFFAHLNCYASVTTFLPKSAETTHPHELASNMT